MHIDTPHFYFVKDAFKVCVPSGLGRWRRLDCEDGEDGEDGWTVRTVPFKKRTRTL